MKYTKNTIFLTSIVVMSSTANASLNWSAGHGDLGLEYKSAEMELEPHWHLGEGNESVTLDDTPQILGPDGLEYEADELVAITAKTQTRSADSAWDFIGSASGETFYVFPEVSDPTVPFLGIGTEELAPSDWLTSLTLTLTAISGSGVDAGGFFSLYQHDGINPPVETMSSFDGISGADAWSQVADDHTHHNWAFTEQGVYNLTFVASGTHATDGVISSAPTTFTFSVVPEPANGGLIMMAASLLYVAASRRRA